MADQNIDKSNSIIIGEELKNFVNKDSNKKITIIEEGLSSNPIIKEIFNIIKKYNEPISENETRNKTILEDETWNKKFSETINENNNNLDMIKQLRLILDEFLIQALDKEEWNEEFDFINLIVFFGLCQAYRRSKQLNEYDIIFNNSKKINFEYKKVNDKLKKYSKKWYYILHSMYLYETSNDFSVLLESYDNLKLLFRESKIIKNYSAAISDIFFLYFKMFDIHREEFINWKLASKKEIKFLDELIKILELSRDGTCGPYHAAKGKYLIIKAQLSPHVSFVGQSDKLIEESNKCFYSAIRHEQINSMDYNSRILKYDVEIQKNSLIKNELELRNVVFKNKIETKKVKAWMVQILILFSTLIALVLGSIDIAANASLADASNLIILLFSCLGFVMALLLLIKTLLEYGELKSKKRFVCHLVFFSIILIMFIVFVVLIMVLPV